MNQIINAFKKLGKLMKHDIFKDTEGIYNLDILLDRNIMYHFEKDYPKDFLLLYIELVKFIDKNHNDTINQKLIGKMQIAQGLMELIIMLRLTNSNKNLQENREKALDTIEIARNNISNGISMYYYKQMDINDNKDLEHVLESENNNISIYNEYGINLSIHNHTPEIMLLSLQNLKDITVNLIDELDNNKKILENRKTILINPKGVLIFLFLIIVLIIILI